MEIAASARKHQAHDRFDDDDIRYAMAHALFAADDGEDADKALFWDPIEPLGSLRLSSWFGQTEPSS